MYGLSKEGSGVAAKVLENQEVEPQKILDKIDELIGREDKTEETLGFTPRTKRVIENAFIEAKKLGYNYIGTEHLLIGILREADSIAARILLDLNVNIPKLYNEIIKVPRIDLEPIIYHYSYRHETSLELSSVFLNLPLTQISLSLMQPLLILHTLES